MPDDVLCDECWQKQWPRQIGRCGCGGYTGSSGYRYCLSCARKKQACQGCGKPHKNGPRVSDR
jgi:hypothetical protein